MRLAPLRQTPTRFPYRPTLEGLEDRTVPATLAVLDEVRDVLFDGAADASASGGLSGDDGYDAHAFARTTGPGSATARFVARLEILPEPGTGEQPGDFLLLTVPDFFSGASGNGTAFQTVELHRGGQFLRTFSTGVVGQGARIGDTIVIEVHATAAGGPPTSIGRASAGVEFTPVPDLKAEALVWNTKRTERPGARGLDFTYGVVGGGALPAGVDVAFYWAKGKTWGDRLGEALPLDLQTIRAVREFPGTHGPITEPARWGEPHPEATHVLMVLDPPSDDRPFGNNVEPDETNNVMALRLHSPEDILRGAVEPRLENGGLTMAASFVPGRKHSDGPFTLSEAEVAFGIENLNWLQTAHGPEYWQIETWKDVRWEDVFDSAHRFIATYDVETGVVTYARGPFIGQAIPGSGQSSGREFIDPVVQSEPGHFLTRVYKISDRGNGEMAFSPVKFNSDDKAPYLQSGEWAHPSTPDNIGGVRSATEFEIRDSPRGPRFIWSIFDRAMLVEMYQGPGDGRTFTTRLVGQGKAGDLVEIADPRSSFSWRSNVVRPLIGGLDGEVEILRGAAPADLSGLVGGIWDVRYGDGTLVPGSPTEPPPLPQLPSQKSSQPPPDRGIIARLVKVGKAKRLFVRVFDADTGALKKQIRSPFQKATHRLIRVLALDSDGDGVPDAVLLTAWKGKKTLRRVLAV